jgi:hypothetical protein
MWLIVAAVLSALLVGLSIVGLSGLSLWRSGRRLLRTAGALMDRASQAADELSALSDGVASNPERLPGRTM